MVGFMGAVLAFFGGVRPLLMAFRSCFFSLRLFGKQ